MRLYLHCLLIPGGLKRALIQFSKFATETDRPLLHEPGEFPRVAFVSLFLLSRSREKKKKSYTVQVRNESGLSICHCWDHKRPNTVEVRSMVLNIVWLYYSMGRQFLVRFARVFLRHQDRNGNSPMHWAVKAENMYTARALILYFIYIPAKIGRNRLLSMFCGLVSMLPL